MFFINMKMKFIKLLLLFSYYTMEIHGSTHWMVTEGGLIQPRVESPFEITHPYDLLAFLNQDIRWNNIFNLYTDLTKRQDIINSLWAELDRDTDITTLLSQDDYCVNAGELDMFDWYTSFMEDGKNKITMKEFGLHRVIYGNVFVPDCKKISSLTFSMCTFEHLEGMRTRENLNANPESSLPEMIAHEMTIEQFGNFLSSALKKNSSSWVHYNLASLYWRVKGVAPKAMECSRRAVHYAPRPYKDIALFNMGMILHRSKMPHDAAIILGAAADHDPQYPLNHFVAGNAYAVIGDYNSSVRHFDACLKLNPSFDLAEKHREGALCHYYLWQKMNMVRETLRRLREELTHYTNTEGNWLKSQSSLLRTMKHADDHNHSDIEESFDKISQLTGINVKEIKKEGDKYSLMKYFLEGPTYDEKWLKQKGVNAIESAYSLERLINHIGRHAKMSNEITINDYVKLPDPPILKEIGPTPTFPDLFADFKNKPSMETDEVEEVIEVEELKEEEFKEVKPESPKQSDKKPQVNVNEVDMSEYYTGIMLYPPTIKVSRSTQDFDNEPDWPSLKLCRRTAPTFPHNIEALYEIFLPFENKGIRLGLLLTEKIGVPAKIEHELPWHPPTCPKDKDAIVYTQKKPQKPQFISTVTSTGYLRQKLLEYVGDGDVGSVVHMQDAEIGQRIYAAMQMKLAPKWLLYTLSSLYWRVRFNNLNALHCIMKASRTVEHKYKDIVLVSMSSIFLEMGYFDESLSAAEEAFRMSLYEPATNFLLAELNMLKKHRNTHMFHLKQALRVEANFMNGLARSVLLGWTCMFKQINTDRELELNEGDICTQVEPGVNMVCQRDTTNCRLSNAECSRKKETSTLVRMLALQDNEGHGPMDEINEHVFDDYLLSMPQYRTDKAAHKRNYDAMMKSVDKKLKGCGNRRCSSIKPEDLELKEEDCAHNHIELGYWMHTGGFKQFLSDSDTRLSSTILSLIPSSKKVPECRLHIDPSQDFFLERIVEIDTEGWEPVLSLMHQFSEVFNFYDFAILGAKIAKYVETRPESWLGMAVAGWWCGAGGRGECAVRCLAAARARAPPDRATEPQRALTALLHVQSRKKEAKEMAYLSFYADPKNEVEAFLVGVSHTYLAEFEPAVWMYRYSLIFNSKFLPAKACLHATMCLMLFGDSAKSKPKQN